MWARWTLSEQIWWSNRDPWALGSCFEIICFEFSCIDLGGPALFNIQMQDFLIKHVICTPGYDLSRESFQMKGLSSWSFLVYRGALYAVTLFLAQTHCKVFKSAGVLICRQWCFMTLCPIVIGAAMQEHICTKSTLFDKSVYFKPRARISLIKMRIYSGVPYI